MFEQQLTYRGKGEERSEEETRLERNSVKIYDDMRTDDDVCVCGLC